MLQQCKECGKKGFVDLRAHLRAHKMTWQQYQEKYNEIARTAHIIIKRDETESMINSYVGELYRRNM